jgi:membrane protein implicated in regulation of membrane protease activity
MDRDVGMLIVGLLIVVVGAIVMIWNLSGENSTTMGIAFATIGIVFIAVSRRARRSPTP